MANNAKITYFEQLGKDNFCTWKLQVQALLVKNDTWGYVSGSIQRPSIPTSGSGIEAAKASATAWDNQDQKAKADLILAICPSELSAIKDCKTSKQVWDRLHEVYESKGPARKANLLKQLVLNKALDDDDIRVHLAKFFDAIDKLKDIEPNIDNDLLSILLLYSLPNNFENFRIAVESRDSLPSPENLKVKILEEYECRHNKTEEGTSGALLADKDEKKNHLKNKKFKFRCFKCNKIGHKKSQCRTKQKSSVAEEAFTMSCTSDTDEKYQWCLDSGATSHMCGQIDRFIDFKESKSNKLNLANNKTATIEGYGDVRISTSVGSIKL